MFVSFLSFSMLARSLQPSSFNSLGRYGAADLSCCTSWFFAGACSSHVSLGAASVDCWDRGCLVETLPPFLVFHVRDNASMSSLYSTYTTTACCLALANPRLSSDGPQLTWPSSAIEPIHGYANGLSMSTTFYPLRASRYTFSAHLGNGHARPGKGVSSGPPPTTPSLSQSQRDPLGPRPSTSRSISVRLGLAPDTFARNSYTRILASGFTRPSAAYSSAAAKHIVQLMDITRVLHLPEELGDLARIIGEHRISPTELREYIELVTPRRSMYEKPTTASHSRRVSSPDAQSKA